MAVEREGLRDWHRLFGLMLTDFFTGSPFEVEVKSHREALDDWAIRELIHHYVAYRKFVSASPSDLLPPERFRLYAVCARFPHNLAGQVPWQERQAAVYDCRWGLDTVRVIVAGQL